VRKTLEEIPGVKVAGAAGNRRVRFDLRAWLVSSGLGVGTFA
jgi:hypothetical protein